MANKSLNFIIYLLIQSTQLRMDCRTLWPIVGLYLVGFAAPLPPFYCVCWPFSSSNMMRRWQCTLGITKPMWRWQRQSTQKWQRWPRNEVGIHISCCLKIIKMMMPRAKWIPHFWFTWWCFLLILNSAEQSTCAIAIWEWGIIFLQIKLNLIGIQINKWSLTSSHSASHRSFELLSK